MNYLNNVTAFELLCTILEQLNYLSKEAVPRDSISNIMSVYEIIRTQLPSGTDFQLYDSQILGVLNIAKTYPNEYYDESAKSALISCFAELRKNVANSIVEEMERYGVPDDADEVTIKILRNIVSVSMLGEDDI